ncbi:MAG: copper amine oxidase N-terminal domain-containing protein [Peptostreptococcaceae bacterium]|nr:copper amine oxidase N-terminal domain-containing protein [Peptostreptococcaceae bacterium]
MKIIKKQFSLLLAMLMIISLVPISASADQVVPELSVIGSIPTFTTADKEKEVKLKIDLGKNLDLKEGRVIFELENAKLATAVNAASAEIYQGKTTKKSPDIVFTSTTGNNVAGGEKIFNLDINSATAANNTDNIEVIVTLKLDFTASSEGDVNLTLRDIGKNGVATGIGDHKTKTATDQKPEAKDIDVKVEKPGTKIGPGGGMLSSILVYQLGKLSDKKDENKLVVTLPSGYLFTPDSKAKTDGAQPMVRLSSDRSELIITNITKDTAYVNIFPDVRLKAKDMEKGKIMAEVELRVNDKKVSSQDVVIGEYASYGLTLTAVEKGTKQIPNLSKGMSKTVELTVKAVEGTLGNGALIDFDIEGAEIVFGKLAVNEPAGIVLTASKSAGSSNKIAGYEVYKSNDFSIRTNKNDIQMIKMTFDIVADPNSSGPVTIKANSAKVDEQKIDIAKTSKTIEVEIVPTSVDKGVIAELPKVVIKEVEKNMLQKGDKLYLELVYAGSDRDKGQHIAFNNAKDIKAETTNNLTVESIELGKQENILVLTIGSRSYEKAGMITLTGIKGYLTEKAVMDRVNLQTTLNNSVESVTPFFTIGKPVSIKTIFTIGNKSYTAAGQQKTLHTAPYINNGRTMLPVRAVGESLGLTASWDNTTKTATFQNAEKVAVVKIGQSTMTVNNTPVPLSAPAEIKDGSTMIELRSLATAFGVNIEWQAATKTVVVNG